MAETPPDDLFMDGPPPGPPLEFYDIPEPPKANGKDHAVPESYTQPPGIKIGKLVVLSDADAKASSPRDYFVKSLISPGEMSCLYGEPGSGKTFLGMHIVRGVAHGAQILGKRVHSANVLYMALEGQSGFEKRLKGFIQAAGETENFYYIAQPVNLFSDPSAPTDIIGAVQATSAGIVIIDTLNRALGEGSENDPADMGQFIKVIDQIRTATGAHVMIIHHSGKDATRGPRGHSALLGAADVVMEVIRKSDTTDRELKIIKAKDDPDGAKYLFRLQVVDLGTDADGDAITTCVVDEITDRAPSDKKTTLTANEQYWLDNIRELFARPEMVVHIKPERAMSVAYYCATRDILREWLKTRGLIGVAESVASNGAVKPTDRSTLSRMLNSLKRKGKIGIHEDYIWLVSE